jgi:LuxR family maltose regulon positive regulatory protein
MALTALLTYRDGDETGAAAPLAEAVMIGQPGHLIRPIADIGPAIVPILNRLNLKEGGLEYVGEIIAAIQTRDESEPGAGQHAPELLSPREVDILQLLAQDLSNKKIAEKLFISTGTVKRHAHNIFGKLAVKNRRDAVSKATGLGILNSQ